jgi:hypothetical protein
MTENKEKITARYRVMEALNERIFKGKNGTLYTFEGICVENPHANTYVFKDHVNEKKACIPLGELEDLVEIKCVPIVT